MKKIVALVLALTMVMACSVALADRLDDIIARGKLVAATSPDWPPYEYYADDDPETIIGTDVLMLEWIAEQLGVQLEIQPMAFDACLAAVGTGSVDVVVAGLTYDEERVTRMELIGTYWNEGDQGLLVSKGEGAKYTTPDDFKGKVVAAQNATLQQIMVEEQLPDAQLQPVTRIPDGVNMVTSGRVAALAVPSTVYTNILAENDQVELAEFMFDNDDAGNYIASVKGEDALTAKLQELVDQINEEGLYQQWVNEFQISEEE